MKVLHISDLHFKDQNTSQDIVVSSLLKKIKEVSRLQGNPDVLVITGDLAFSGKETEYDKVSAFISEIISACDINEENVVIIPGNHDVDRSKIKPGHLNWWYNFANESSLKEVLESDDSLPKIISKTESYNSFSQSIIKSSTVYGRFGQYYLVPKLKEEKRVGVKFLGFNTSLFCGYDGDDKAKLAIGLEQLSYFDDKIDAESEIIISCIHHPFTCFHECESPTLKYLQRVSDLILSGHLHEESNSFRKESNTGETVFISAGAGFERRESQNSFNIIEIDLVSLAGKVTFYKYVHSEHIWIVNKDINHETNGVFEFNINKKRLADIKSEHNESAVGRVSYVLNLSFPLEEMDREKYSSIVDNLKEITGDHGLTVTRMIEGSTKLFFWTVSKVNENMLKNLFSKIVGIVKIEQVQISEYKYDTSILNWNIKIKSDYLNELLNTGANFIHNRIEELKLHDLFVSPNFRKISIDANITEANPQIINSRDVFTDSVSDSLKIVVYGADSSGKTTLMKWVYLKYYNLGYIPILISGSNIKDIAFEKILGLVEFEFMKQYSLNEKNILSDIDKNKVIIIIDDFHRIRFSKAKYKANLISNILKITSNVIIAGNELMQYETYTAKNGNSRNILEGFSMFHILEYGPTLRHELIAKWNGLGIIGVDPNEVIRLNNESESHVDAIIGKNFVPSYPIYLLTILQAKDVSFNQNPEYSLHGFYYELLINESLNKSVRNKEEISLFYNYITDYCYFLFDQKIRLEPLEYNSLKLFHERYCSDYNVSINLKVVLNTLINSRLLKLDSTEQYVSVTYKYVYYFFTAKYLANHISDELIRSRISQLCLRVHRDEYASIVLFLTHLSKDQFVVNELLKVSKNLFSEFSPIKLEDDVSFINDMVNKLPEQFYLPKDLREVKLDELKEVEEFDKQEKEFSSDRDVFEYDLDEDINSLDVLSKLIKAIKTIEITGQVTKKYWGSLKSPQKYELALETYSLGLRTLGFYFSLFEKDTDVLVDYLSYLLRKRNPEKGFTRSEVEKASRNFLFSLSAMASYGIVKKISNSIGYEKLAGTFEDLIVENPINSFRLIDTAIKLDHSKDIPWKNIQDMLKITKGHYLSRTVLQNLAINYLYVFHTTYSDKQKLCAMLGIKMATQRYIDATSVVKKE